MTRAHWPRRLKLISKLMVRILGVAAIMSAVSLYAGCSMFSAPGYSGLKNEYFDGEQFHNLDKVSEKNLFTLLKWRFTSEKPEWEDRRHIPPGDAPAERTAINETVVTWIGHSTTLIQIESVNILVDPVWSERASPFSWAGPARYRQPGIRYEDLPPIDIVLISHNHYDHLDLPTLKRLEKDHSPLIVAGLGTSTFLAREQIQGATDIGWWETLPVAQGLKIHGVPARHWSKRGGVDRNNTLWLGFVIEGNNKQIYYSGDTGWGKHFSMIHERFGDIDLALLPIGAYKPRWFMKDMHISPAEAVKVASVLKAGHTIPVHYGVFQLADDGQDEPLEDLRAALEQAAGAAPRFEVLKMGDSFTL